MSADIKWEAVDWSALRQDDTIRVLHKDGDVIHGTFHEERTRSYLKSTFGRFFVASNLVDKGFKFERAVPERTLPTEPGLYVEAGHYPAPGYVIYSLHDAGHWAHDGGGVKWHRTDDDSDIPDGLVRLVPVTQVEEAEKRAKSDATHVVQYLTAIRSSVSQADIDYILHNLKREAFHV